MSWRLQFQTLTLSLPTISSDVFSNNHVTDPSGERLHLRSWREAGDFIAEFADHRRVRRGA